LESKSTRSKPSWRASALCVSLAEVVGRGQAQVAQFDPAIRVD